MIEKKVSRSEVTQRTNALVKKLLAAESDASRLLRTKELSEHIGQFPPTRVKAVEVRFISENKLTIIIVALEYAKSFCINSLMFLTGITECKQKPIVFEP